MLTKGLVGIIALYFSLRSYIGSFSEVDPFELLDEYDFIVVGSGASGSVLIKRLSDGGSGNTVLMIEAGTSAKGDVTIETPFLVNELHQTFRDWQFQTNIQTNLKPAKVFNLPHGKVGGGTTALNYLLYNRGSRHDYDSWRNNGAIGWEYNSIKKYFKKVEKAGTNMSNTLSDSGQVGLSRGYFNKFVTFVLDVAKEIGYPEVDYSAGGLAEGFSIPIQTTTNGKRQYAANAYLWDNLKNSKNLHASFKTLAHRVTFDTDQNILRASGVEAELPNGKMKTFRARKEVILCAGAIKSPQLLMLSGIGPRNHLSRFSIPVIRNLPGVGSNLQDHVSVPTYYYAKEYKSFDKLTSRQIFSSFLDYMLRGVGPMSMPNGPAVIGHLRSSYFGTPTASSLFRHPFPELQYLFVQKEVKVNDVGKDKAKRHEVAGVNLRGGVMYNMFAKTTLLHPKSRGTVRLATNSANKQPLIDPRYLDNDDDLKILIDGLKTVELFENSVLFRHNNISMVMNDLCLQNAGAKKSYRSDAFYECIARNNAVPGHSFCCTNRMGYSRDRNSVVDKDLRVHGVTGLRVADASVMPHLTSSNIQAACYAIGEKAADVIQKHWNI